MKKVSEALTQTQSQTAVRQALLESGKIRVVPESPTAAPPQEAQGHETGDSSR